MQSTNDALSKIFHIMHAIEPILFDIKDGTMKRVFKSNFDPSKSRIMSSDDFFANEDDQQRISEEQEENNDTAKFNNK